MKLSPYVFIIIIAILMVFPLWLPAQEVDRWNMLDPFLKNKLRQQGITSEIFRQDQLPEFADSLNRKSDGKPVYHVILHGSPDVTEKLKIHRNTVFQNFTTARVDLQELHHIAGHAGVNLIEHGLPMEIQLDISRSEIGSDLVNDGFGIETAYTGSEVIVGIIDTGIDIFHPDFFFMDSSEGTRILSIWDTTLEPQNDEVNPVGFDYGVEYTKADIDATRNGTTDSPVRSVDSNGHGTHVAGIAAGNGSANNGYYQGIAPEAYLIIVRFPPSGISSSVLIDGISYIFDKADDLQRPAVINLSIGGHGGAHDGTSPEEEAIKSYAGESGKAVVVASGNSGAQKIHTGGVVVPSDTAYMVIDIQDYSPANTNYALNLLWYENLDNQGTGPFPAETMNLTVVSPRGYRLSVNSGQEESKNTEDGKIIIESYGKNQKNARLLYIEITDSDEEIPPRAGSWEMVLIHASGEGNVQYNLWAASHTFGNKLEVHPTSEREYTVTIPGTAEGVITVGSYTTKNTWIDKNGTVQSKSATIGAISNYSGGGPTRDGRLKPTITGPGQMIAAPASSQASFSSSRLTEVSGYVVLEGTSLSTPHVSGTVALLFEINSSLDVTQIKQIISSTGRKDNETGIVPNSSWGYGKVDVYNAAIEAGAVVSVNEIQSNSPVSYFLRQNFPNPFNPSTLIRYGIPGHAHVKLMVYNQLGQLIEMLVDQELDAGTYEVEFNASHLPSGVYIYRLQAGGYGESKKLLLLK
jgi:subtilisin family serine protease